MIVLLFAMLQVGPVDSGRLDRCIDLARTDPDAARAEATRWRVAGGGTAARQCEALALTQQQAWPAAAAAFEAAARAAEMAKDMAAPRYWALAGNAWLAAGEIAKARTALGTALAAGTLKGLERGEAQLDHARVLVADGDMAAARIDIDVALTTAAADPLAWLLSATLARRTNDLPRAQKDIAEALRLSADDASVQLEAGNIAARLNDEAGARAAWRQAARLAPASDAGRAAGEALKQFDAPAG